MILRSIGVYRLYMDKKWGQAENAWIWQDREWYFLSPVPVLYESNCPSMY
jgi:hypothetical protein